MALFRLVIPTLLFFLYGCGFHALQEEWLENFGRFEFREPAVGLEGVVIGAPHGRTDRYTDRIAKSISTLTGAGLVVAYGFKSKRLAVSEPITRSRPYPVSRSRSQPGSVYREYKKVLRKAAKGAVALYVGVHRSDEKKVTDRIEVASSGLTFEEAKALKGLFAQIRDRSIAGRRAARLELAMEPLDPISWRVSGVKHHGVLLAAEKGLNLRLPQILSESDEELYTDILSRWVQETIVILRENPLGLPQIQVQLTDFGRLELLGSRKQLPGIVIGSPHGSYDEYTAELVKRLSYRTGLAAVIAKGFTPTETGGARINVNRPTEKLPYSEGRELHSQRAREAYHVFKDLVFEASGGGLELYIDVHQYNTDSKIQVATVGVSQKEARIIKKIYRGIRDEALKGQSHLPAVELLMEPIDEIGIGAWSAKAEGILGLARKSLHFEIPSNEVLATAEARESYTRIFSFLFEEVVPVLLTDRGATR